jgi:hypothetical protein
LTRGKDIRKVTDFCHEIFNRGRGDRFQAEGLAVEANRNKRHLNDDVQKVEGRWQEVLSGFIKEKNGGKWMMLNHDV